MKAKHDTNRKVMGCIALLLSVVAASSYLSCDGDPRIVKPCWMGIDTLFVSGVMVGDTSGVRIVFESYLTYIDTTGAELEDGSYEWVFEKAEFDHEFQGTQYWKIWHWAKYHDQPDPILRRLIDADQNGVLVKGLGCI